jgi:hypothetical protein
MQKFLLTRRESTDPISPTFSVCRYIYHRQRKPHETAHRRRITPFDIIRQWAPRLIAATLFLFVGASKFSEHSEWVVIFTKISAEGAREAMKEFRRIAIPPEAVGRAIAFAIEQPDDVDVNEILVRPTASPY